MNTKIDRYHIDIRGISVEVVRKDIKNFHVSVHPPNGGVRVSAPLYFNDDTIRMAIISRLGIVFGVYLGA